MELTRFEKARIIGARALQIAYGAPVLIRCKKDPMTVAENELKRGVLPITVVRE